MIICSKYYTERDCTGNTFILFSSASSICSIFVFKKGEKKQISGIFVEGQEYWIKLLCLLKDCQQDKISEEITFILTLCYQICILINNKDLYLLSEDMKLIHEKNCKTYIHSVLVSLLDLHYFIFTQYNKIMITKLWSQRASGKPATSLYKNYVKGAYPKFNWRAVCYLLFFTESVEEVVDQNILYIWELPFCYAPTDDRASRNF